MNGKVEIKLLGLFGKLYGSNKVTLEIVGTSNLREVIMRLADSSQDLRRILIDPVLESPLPNSVILVNNRDISALRGLETPIMNGDKIVIIPVIHGG